MFRLGICAIVVVDVSANEHLNPSPAIFCGCGVALLGSMVLMFIIALLVFLGHEEFSSFAQDI